ncbi:hypothetical protein [Halodesulfovibrio spirochaetisodalis]|uniref:Membrane protein n=1 Tax=Halodesulfovibrio spirochaetisodalis TaxID=1560234 RepID=A0A1B7XCU9_9BACT|nr:hypothetical protein [Halodesulfovibrio spirochaetisodalis]OBQ51721.1 membrane protein [Halodesulfovibrio spirochaetisodalis]
MEPLSLTTLLVCFGGGILGGALGGLLSFVLCGLFVFSGCLIALAGGGDFMFSVIGFGPVFGPHVGGFAAGVAAANYAQGVRKNHPTGGAKDILASLMPTSWDVLLVGGIFAVFGYLCNLWLASFMKGQDTIAITVLISAFVSRALFLRQSPFGNSESIKKFGLLGTDDTNLSWVPWMLPFSRMIMFAIGIGLVSGGAAMAIGNYAEAAGIASGATVTAQVVIGWAVAAVSLIALQLGNDTIQRVPVWHCQAILAGIAWVNFGNLGVCVVAAVAGALLQELGARLFWNHGDTHVDPPAFGIAVGTCILNLLA